MKKSLIALAVLAASGASFAQVSVTGNLTYGYQSTSDGGASGVGANDTAGLGAETANVVFTANEDLGGGYAAKASLKINTGAQAATTGDDHTLTLTTPVGGLILGTVKAADYLSGGIAGVGAYYTGWDGTSGGSGANNGKILSARTSRDFVSFVIPVGAFTLSVTQQEPANTVGFGNGTTGSLASGGTLQGHTVLSATYAAGPLVANGQYFLQKNPNVSGNAKDTTRLSASYDLGVAKIGAGAVLNNVTGNLAIAGAPNAKITDYLIGVKAPMGASSFGATFVSRQISDGALLGATDGTGTGYSLEYGYSMSKRTSVIVNYARWTQISGATGLTAGRDASSQYNILLSHSF